MKNLGEITVAPSIPSAEDIGHNLKSLWKGFRYLLYYGFFTTAFTLSAVPIFTHYQFAPDLSSADNLKSKKDTGVILEDRTGKPFFSLYSSHIREDIPLKDIPKYTRQAVISVEDKDFYYHNGFSAKSIIRAAVDNFEDKGLNYGASTITQQLTKNTLLTPQKTLMRKYQEVILATEIEKRYSKDQILEMYLNSVYFGQGAFGIEEAAKAYFDKKAKDLSLAESALLASLLPAPSKLSVEAENNQDIKERVNLVLQKMKEQKYITQKQMDEALQQKLVLSKKDDNLNQYAAHFALMVRDQLIEKYGEENLSKSGYKVKTSLNLDYQKMAEEEVQKQVKNLKRSNVSNGAVVVLDPKTGEILAMVGSTSWFDEEFGKVNVAFSPRPPGSSFKPIVYLRAFEKGLITPATILDDSPKSFANFDEKTYFASFPTKETALRQLASDPNAYYKPSDYDRKFRGHVTVRRALSNSLNIPAVEVMKKVGVSDAVDFANEVGISTIKDPSNYGLSLVLGAGEVRLLDLTSFYAALANKGVRVEPADILEIDDRYGNVVYKSEKKEQRIAEEKSVFLLTSILSDNQSRQEMFGSALTINRPAAVKTGTTDNYRDSWTLGFTPSLAIGVWVGNNDGQAMDNIAGSLGAAPIWKALMTRYLEGKPVEQFEMPDGVVKQNICTYSKDGKVTGATSEYFIKGTEPRLVNCIVFDPNKQISSSGSKPASPVPSSGSPVPSPQLQSSASTPSPKSSDKKD